MGEPGCLPSSRKAEAMPDIKIRIAVVQLRVEGVEITKLIGTRRSRTVTVAEGRGQIIQGVGPCIVRSQPQSLVSKVSNRILDVQSVVMAVALIAAVVHIAVLIIEAVTGVRIPQEGSTTTGRIDVG